MDITTVRGRFGQVLILWAILLSAFYMSKEAACSEPAPISNRIAWAYGRVHAECTRARKNGQARVSGEDPQDSMTRLREDRAMELALREKFAVLVAPEMIQKEMERIARNTASPELYNRVVQALGRDPTLVAEALARPSLVHRLFRQRVEPLLATHPIPAGAVRPPGKLAAWLGVNPNAAQRRGMGTPDRIAIESIPFLWERLHESQPVLDEEGSSCPDSSQGPSPTWVEWWRENRLSYLRDEAIPGPSEAAYFLPETSLDEACLDTWKPLGSPHFRFDNVAVWTGSRMFVWGGSIAGLVRQSFGLYDPEIDAWTNIPFTPGALPGRIKATGVWTGEEILMFGGYDEAYLYGAGARYNPATGHWHPMSAVGAPSPRAYHTAVWTGREMIVWGGYDGGYRNDGGIYDPSTDAWRPLPLDGTSPTARADHTAVWTGEAMIVWGGFHGVPAGRLEDDSVFDGTGALYHPETGTWTRVSEGPGCPLARTAHTAAWTGEKMIIFGGAGSPWREGADIAVRSQEAASDQGWTFCDPPNAFLPYIYTFLDTGAVYDPVRDTWEALPPPTDQNLPGGRMSCTSVWTGSKFLVWGGYFGLRCLGTGAAWDAESNLWSSIPETPSSPSGRAGHSAFWLGEEMLIWGGGLTGGGLYNPITGAWRDTQDDHFTQFSFDAAWADTGAELIVYGGYWNAFFNWPSMRYDYLLDEWLPLAAEGAPPGVCSPTSVWTGHEFVVWSGGYPQLPGRRGVGFSPTGARYDLEREVWRPMATEGSPPPREGGKAIWTGSQVIVWGASSCDSCSNSGQGARYDPTTDRWSPLPDFEDFYGYSIDANILAWTGQKIIGCTGNSIIEFDPAQEKWYTPLPKLPTDANWGPFCWTGTDLVSWENTEHWGVSWRYDPLTKLARSLSLANAPGEIPFPNLGMMGREMISYSGDDGYTPLPLQNGRYDVATDSWIRFDALGSDMIPRWNSCLGDLGGRCIIWGGSRPYAPDCLKDGSIYIPSKRLWPTVSGPSAACAPSTVTLETEPSSSYQWYRDSQPIAVADGRTLEADETGDYQVAVRDSAGCQGMSAPAEVTIEDPPKPTIQSTRLDCATVSLEIPELPRIRWTLDGIEIPGVTGATLVATAPGVYGAEVWSALGCHAQTPPLEVLFAPDIFPGSEPVEIRWGFEVYACSVLFSTDPAGVRTYYSSDKYHPQFSGSSWMPDARDWKKIIAPARKNAGPAMPLYFRIQSIFQSEPSVTGFLCASAPISPNPISPANGSGAAPSTPPQFAWDLRGDTKPKVEFCANPSFGGTVKRYSLPDGTASWTPKTQQWAAIVHLGSDIYWRVRGKDGWGRLAFGPAKVLRVGS